MCILNFQNRVWQRDCRDRPIIQPDITYFNEVSVQLTIAIECDEILQVLPPQSLPDMPVNAVTTKFVRASTNKARCPIFCTSVSLMPFC